MFVYNYFLGWWGRGEDGVLGFIQKRVGLYFSFTVIFHVFSFLFLLLKFGTYCLANFVYGLFLRQAKDVMKAVKRRLQHRSPKVQLLSLTVIFSLPNSFSPLPPGPNPKTKIKCEKACPFYMQLIIKYMPSGKF